VRAYAAEHPKDAVLFGRADFSTVPPTTRAARCSTARFPSGRS